MQERRGSCFTQLYLCHSERCAQARVPDEPAYLCFGNLRSESAEDHPYARRNA